MPTINAYKDKSGYFIRAWTSDLGNINYKLHDRGNKIVDEIGLSDGDDISWDTIQTLRAAGELYTEQSGTLGPDDVIPPDGSAKNLSTEEAEQLFEVTLDAGNPSRDQIAQISDILDIESPNATVETLEKSLEEKVSKVSIEQLQTEYLLYGDSEVSTLSVDVQDVREDDETPHLYRIGIFLLGDVDRKNPGMARHDVVVCEDHGLEAWNFAVSGEKSWEKHAEMAQQKSQFLPVVIEWLRDLDVDIQTPDEAFGTGMQGMM